MKTITIDDNQAILDLMRFILGRIDPEGEHFFASSAKEGLDIIEKERIRIVFLDIEMPYLSGDAAAKILLDRYKLIDIIFITGHTEYALLGHRLHCAAFVTKPFNEKDIVEALEYLRIPVASPKKLKVRCENFSVFTDNGPVVFERGRTEELFAYLVYKNGSFATNGELIAILWEGAPDKQDLLRKLIKDMRDRFDTLDADRVLIKKRGCISINMKEIEAEGDVSAIAEQYGWML